jgi:hypothetical protein
MKPALPKTLAKSAHRVGECLGRLSIEEPDRRHRRLLRARNVIGHAAAPPSRLESARRFIQ